jgi:hypothetical protein
MTQQETSDWIAEFALKAWRRQHPMPDEYADEVEWRRRRLDGMARITYQQHDRDGDPVDRMPREDP